MAKKQINKKATIKNIMDWANSSIGHGIDTDKFNKKMEGSGWKKFLVEASEFCGTEIVYK